MNHALDGSGDGPRQALKLRSQRLGEHVGEQRSRLALEGGAEMLRLVIHVHDDQLLDARTSEGDDRRNGLRIQLRVDDEGRGGVNPAQLQYRRDGNLGRTAEAWVHDDDIDSMGLHGARDVLPIERGVHAVRPVAETAEAGEWFRRNAGEDVHTLAPVSVVTGMLDADALGPII